MKTGKLKQFGLILNVIIALLIVPIVPCACDHGQISSQTSEHCEPKPQPVPKTDSKDLPQQHETVAAHSHDTAGSVHHHQAKAPAVPAKEAAKEELETVNEDRAAKAEGSSRSFAESCDCCSCTQAAPRAFAKSETLKINKQVVLMPLADQTEEKFKPQIVAAGRIEFVRPFYLSDSFYNLHPGRAPPIS